MNANIDFSRESYNVDLLEYIYGRNFSFLLLNSTLRKAHNNVPNGVEVFAFSGLNYEGPHCNTRVEISSVILLDEIFEKFLYCPEDFRWIVQVLPFQFPDCIS